MTWSRQQYEDRIRDRLGDLGILQHIGEERIPLALERAIATFTRDNPREASQTFSGDGTTQTFDLTLGAAWVKGWSDVISVEHPTGKIPRELVDAHDWFLEDGQLVLLTAPATGTNNIKIRHLAAWDFPDDNPADDPNPIPEVYAQAIADLAAAYVARGEANEFARQKSTSVAGDLYQRDPGPLYEAARLLERSYTDTVLGRPAGEAPAQTALAVSDVDVFGGSLFHRRSQYIGQEALGD